MPNLISTTTPLAGAGVYTSTSQNLSRATTVSGTVFADVNGTAYVDWSGDGVNWDVSNAVPVTGGTGVSFEFDVIAQNFRLRYVNGATAQTTFRLFGNTQDPYGAFLTAAGTPSAGGAWIVLYWNPATAGYTVVGRFDGIDGWNANGNAAVYSNKNGKYACFPVADATVSTEVLQTLTQHGPDVF